MNTKLLQENLFQDIDFKELSKTCKTQGDIPEMLCPHYNIIFKPPLHKI